MAVVQFFICLTSLANFTFYVKKGRQSEAIFHRHFHPCAWWEYILHQLPGEYGMSLVAQCAAHLVHPGAWWISPTHILTPALGSWRGRITSYNQGRTGYNLIRSSYRARPDGRGWSESAAPTRCYILAFCSTDYCNDHYFSFLLHSWHKKTYKHFIQKLLGKFTERNKLLDARLRYV